MAAPAAIGGGILFAVSLSNRDHPAWPGVPLGILIALFAFGVVSAVVAGAQARARGGASSIGLIVAGAAIVIAVLSVFLEPFGLVALLPRSYGSPRPATAAPSESTRVSACSGERAEPVVSTFRPGTARALAVGRSRRWTARSETR